MGIIIGGLYVIITMIIWLSNIESLFIGTEYVYLFVKYEELIIFGGYISLFIVLPLLLLFLIVYKSDLKFQKSKKNYYNKHEIFNHILEKYIIFLKNNGVNIDKKVSIKKNNKSVGYYMWIQDNSLKFVNIDEIYKLALGNESLDEYKGNENKYEEMFKMYYNDMIIIPINKIYYFKLEGNVHYETKISGGDGGGSDIGGALLGGAIAGSTGAIIGSRKKTNPIISEYIEHDERYVVLKYYDETNKLNMINFAYYSRGDNTVIDDLEDLMPDKEYNVVIKRQEEKVSNNTNFDIASRLSKLIELKENGLITEHEYNYKKQSILDSI